MSRRNAARVFKYPHKQTNKQIYLSQTTDIQGIQGPYINIIT